jgi:hypothetical protein
MGPVFNEVSIDGDQLHVECSGVSRIFLYNGGKKPGYLHAMPGETLTSADFTIDKNARYVRVSIQDAAGSFATAAGIFAKNSVSFSAAMQKDSGSSNGYATVIIITHETSKANMDATLKEIMEKNISESAPVCLGIEE